MVSEYNECVGIKLWQLAIDLPNLPKLSPTNTFSAIATVCQTSECSYMLFDIAINLQ